MFYVKKRYDFAHFHPEMKRDINTRNPHILSASYHWVANRRHGLFHFF